jgi:mono/diheme cytochrome c family protein
MKTHLFLFTASLIMLLAPATIAQKGENLFKTNCGACHTVGKGKLVGPDLIGVENRHSEDWLLKWITGSQALIKSGDTAAVHLFKEYNGIPMADLNLSREDVLAVLSFIKDEGTVLSTPPQSDALTASATAVTTISAESRPVAKEAKSLLNVFSFSEYVLVCIIILLVAVIWILSSTIKVLVSEN